MSEMTATRMGLPLRLATLALAAGAWAAASYLLWSTTREPGGLHLGGLSESRYFSASFLHRAEHYERFGYLLWAAETAATIVVLALYAWRGARFARESAAGRIGTGMLLAMLGFGLVWLVSVPFEVLSLWWAAALRPVARELRRGRLRRLAPASGSSSSSSARRC